MNKVTKGALATAAGVALLLGGGGTLALWNTEMNASAGKIVAGDLGLVPSGTGAWSNATGPISDIAKYRIVPGETLTYTQSFSLTLIGDKMAATLNVTGEDLATTDTEATFKATNIAVSPVTLVGADGFALPTTLTSNNNGNVVTASTSFTFKSSTAGVEDTNALYDFAGVGYELTQLTPQ